MLRKKKPKVKPFPIRLVERAKQFVGVKEHPPGSNRGPYNKKLRGGIDNWCMRAAGVLGYPWCAAFVCAMSEDVGYRITEPYRAGVEQLERWAQRVGKIVARPLRGDLVCYDWDRNDWMDHVGIVDRVLALKWRGGRFVGFVRTVEGNTSAGNNSNGGQVQIRYRWVNDKTRFIRLIPRKKS